MMRFLEKVLPGNSARIRRLREDVIDFAASPMSKSVLLRGPIGSGKSTLARAIGLMRRVAPLLPEEAEQILADVRFDGPNQIALRSIITWYVEHSLTGLVENLAEAQLFGTGKGAFTGAVPNPGIFEKASRGLMPKGKESSAAQLTGGVVFLDEIGDLTPKLQAKLLPVLSGGVYYRLGTEGQPNTELEFRGVTITASWRRLNADILRPDLLSRIAGYTIDVPGLDDRMDDFDILLDVVQEILLNSLHSEIERYRVVEPNLDRAYWIERVKCAKPIDAKARAQLARVDWNRHANMRGLTAAVEKICFAGRRPDQVISELPIIDDEAENEPTKNLDLLTELVDGSATGEGLAAHVHAFEIEQRTRLRKFLFANPTSLARVATALGIEERKLKLQLRQIDRERRQG